MLREKQNYKTSLEEEIDDDDDDMESTTSNCCFTTINQQCVYFWGAMDSSTL